MNWTPMNPHAKEHFQNNPDAKYWYFSRSIRVPNPNHYRRPDYVPDPWPQEITP